MRIVFIIISFLLLTSCAYSHSYQDNDGMVRIYDHDTAQYEWVRIIDNNEVIVYTETRIYDWRSGGYHYYKHPMLRRVIRDTYHHHNRRHHCDKWKRSNEIRHNPNFIRNYRERR